VSAAHTEGVMTHASLMGSIHVGFRDEAIFHCGLGLRHNSFVHEQEANARRLAACWNACVDVPVEVLEANASGGLPWTVADQIDARVERLEIVAALVEAEELIARRWGYPNDASSRSSVLARLRGAIASATGSDAQHPSGPAVRVAVEVSDQLARQLTGSDPADLESAGNERDARLIRERAQRMWRALITIAATTGSASHG
jgi:hypothetical protein